MLVNVKLEIKRYIPVCEDCISRLYSKLDRSIFDGRAKTKLAMLAFMYCREFVKTRITSI